MIRELGPTGRIRLLSILVTLLTLAIAVLAVLLISARLALLESADDMSECRPRLAAASTAVHTR